MADIRKLFNAAVVKLRPGMSVQEAAVSVIDGRSAGSAEHRHVYSHLFFPDERRTQNRKRVVDGKKVADIRKLFCAAVVKLRPGMSVQAAALSFKTEFDTDHNGVIDRAEFGVMISKVLRLSSDVEELLWSSCCKHETFAKWVVGDGTAEGRNGGDDGDIDRAEFEGVISKVLALRLPGYVEELLWIDFCGHESFASWVGDDAETAEETDSQRQWTQPRAVNCWGGDDAGSAVQYDMKASASVRTRSRPQPGSERSPTTSRFVSTTTTVGLTAEATQSTDLVQNGKGHLPAKVWRASPKRTLRRLNLDAKGRGAARGPPPSWDG